MATTDRGYVQVDDHLRTTARHVFARGDITGRVMLVPHAVQDGYLAATNAVEDRDVTLSRRYPIGSFTDPEYAQVGPTEAQARRDGDVVAATVPFAVTTRPIIDGRPGGFCKLIVDRATHRMIGCHVVGERAVEIAQVAAVAVAAQMPVEQFVRIPLSFPTYTNVLGRAALDAARQLDVAAFWDQPRKPETVSAGKGPSKTSSRFESKPRHSQATTRPIRFPQRSGVAAGSPQRWCEGVAPRRRVRGRPTAARTSSARP